MRKLLNDEELDKLDPYKDSKLIKAINECNTYVQNGAIITMLDKDKNDNVHYVSRNVLALYEVMHYVNECSIPREALIEIIFNLFQFAQEQKLAVDSDDFKRVSFTVNILQQILYENTAFQVYSCKRGFIPKLELNIKGTTVKRGEILYLLEKSSFKDKRDNHIIEASVFFDVVSGYWVYLLDSELINLKKEKLKFEDEAN